MARFRPVAVERLSDGVVEQFREMLLLGQLVPGQRLPNERELGEMFGVSRNSVRGAAPTRVAHLGRTAPR